jgi:hypothetical protein
MAAFAAAQQVLDLIFPPRCAGCDAAGSVLCAKCRASGLSACLMDLPAHSCDAKPSPERL